MNEDRGNLISRKKPLYPVVNTQVSHGRFNALIAVVEEDCITEPTNVERLAEQLAEYYQADAFLHCTSMGALVGMST